MQERVVQIILVGARPLNLPTKGPEGQHIGPGYHKRKGVCVEDAGLFGVHEAGELGVHEDGELGRIVDDDFCLRDDNDVRGVPYCSQPSLPGTL